MPGVRGRSLSHPRPPVLSGVPPGPTTHWLWVRGVRVWGPVTSPTARALASWLCALWGRHEGSQGGRLLTGCGAPGVGRYPTPDHSCFRACGRGPLPTGCGCGGCGRGPVTNPTARAPASWPCALWGRHEGARGAGGASSLGVGRLMSGALPPPTIRAFGRAAGAHYPLAVGAGDAGLGTCHQPHSAHSWELALRAVGAARGRPGGAPLAWVWGARGRALSDPRPLVLLGVRPGPTTHWLWVRGVRACGPVTNPTARALASWLCALWGRHEGARGGAPLAWVWGVRGLALSHPRPFVLLGVRPGPTDHWLWVRGLWAWGPVTNPTARASASWLCPLWGRQEGARGGRLLPGCGPSGFRRSPTPDHSSFQACGRGPLPTGCGCGGCGRGDPSPAPQRVLLQAGFACCGSGMRVPGGGASCLGVGRPGWGAVPPPTTHPFGHAAGPTTHWLWARGVRGWRPVTNPTARALACWLCALWGRHEVAWGGRLLPGCGVSGDGPSPTPDLVFFRACGRGPLPTGRGCGVRAWGPGCPWHLLRAAVCRVLCALPGFAAPGGCCGFAPVLVPWLWPAACLSGVPPGPALVRRASSRPVTFGAPVGFPVAVVPSPTPGAVAPGFTGWLRGARGGRPRTGLFVPASGHCRGRGAGRAPCRTRSGPRDGVVPGGSLRLWSWAACAAVVKRVWTRSLTRPVSRTVRLSTGDSASAPGLFRVDADTSSFGSDDATPGSCACAFFLRRVGRAGLPGAFWCASRFPVAVLGALFVCSAPFGLGSPCLWFFLLSSTSAPPLCPAFRVSRPRVPWALASCAPLPPHSEVSFFSLLRPPVTGVPWFPALGALGLGVLSPPPPLGGFLFPPLGPIVSGVPCFPALGALGLGAAACAALCVVPSGV